MKTAGYCVLLASSGFIASDYLPGAEVIQCSALAILGWVVWYLLARAMPAHTRALEADRRAFLEAQREERREFRDSLASLTGAVDRVTTAIIGNHLKGGD